MWLYDLNLKVKSVFITTIRQLLCVKEEDFTSVFTLVKENFRASISVAAHENWILDEE